MTNSQANPKTPHSSLDSTKDHSDIFAQLAAPLDHKWRIQGVWPDKANPKKCICTPFITAFQAMDRLDKVLGPVNWQNDYKSLEGQVLCGIGALSADGWVWKWDGGTAGEFEKEKSVLSDSFKRAAVHWGIGRYLKDIDEVWLDVNDYKKAVDDLGGVIKDLTQYICKMPGQMAMGKNNQVSDSMAGDYIPPKQTPEEKHGVSGFIDPTTPLPQPPAETPNFATTEQFETIKKSLGSLLKRHAGVQPDISIFKFAIWLFGVPAANKISYDRAENAIKKWSNSLNKEKYEVEIHKEWVNFWNEGM